MSANPWCAHLIDVARQVIERVADPDLRAAFLFGSAAWGDADAGSDLDIMLLLDRPAGFREVTRVRVADLLARPLPDGPAFADFDRYSAAAFAEITAAGGGAQRVIHSVVLRDTDRFFAAIRDRVHAAYFDPAARAARYRVKRERAAAHRAALRQSRAADPALAALHARLALDEAAGALLELNDDRLSLTHFVESVGRALARLGRAELVAPFLRALGLDATPERQVDQSLRAYRAFAAALRGWMADPAVGGRLSHEDRAWAEFTYGAQTYEEIAHKVDTFTRLGRAPALLYYLDGLLLVPIRLNVGKVLLLRADGAAGRITIPDFQAALRAEPALYEIWLAALRLTDAPAAAEATDALAGQLLRLGDDALAREPAGGAGV